VTVAHGLSPTGLRGFHPVSMCALRRIWTTPGIQVRIGDDASRPVVRESFMAALLGVIIAIGTALLAITAYLKWIGVTSLFTATRTNPSYDSCGHLKLNLSSHHHKCWRCRHDSAAHGRRTLHH
jgi:hypothetical protein